MAVLAFDTTTDLCSVACLHNNNLIKFVKQTSSARNSLKNQNMAAVLVPLLQKCLIQIGVSFEQVDTIMLPRGPGSFTGIRIGFSVMNGLIIAQKYKVIAPTIFDIWANTYKSNKILMLMDNKQGKFYAAEAYNGIVNYDMAGIMSYDQVNELKSSYEHIISDQPTDIFTKPRESIAEQLINMYQENNTSVYAREIIPYYLHNPAFQKI